MKGELIEAKLLASNFAVDAFTTAAFSMSMTADEPIANFDEVPFVKAMIDFLTPSAAILIPILIPYGQVDQRIIIAIAIAYPYCMCYTAIPYESNVKINLE